jgi:hypothetical protein
MQDVVKKNCWKSRFTILKLSTFATIIEGLLNSRPLCYFRDSEEGILLTPGHLLVRRNLQTQQPLHSSLNQDCIGRQYQLLAQMYKQFWELWSKYYIHHFYKRYQWKTEEK